MFCRLLNLQSKMNRKPILMKMALLNKMRIIKKILKKKNKWLRHPTMLPTKIKKTMNPLLKNQ